MVSLPMPLIALTVVRTAVSNGASTHGTLGTCVKHAQMPGAFAAGQCPAIDDAACAAS